MGHFPPILVFCVYTIFFGCSQNKDHIRDWVCIIEWLSKARFFNGLFHPWTWNLKSREIWEQACQTCFMLKMINLRAWGTSRLVWSHKYIRSGFARQCLSAFVHALPSSWNSLSSAPSSGYLQITSSFKTHFRHNLLFSTTSGCTKCPGPNSAHSI